MNEKKTRCLALILGLMLLGSGLFAPARAENAWEAADPFFEDTVFVGDSIMAQLGRYQAEAKKEGIPLLGEARFLAAVSYTLFLGSRQKAQPDKITLKIKGNPVSLHEGLKKLGAKRAFVMLGINDNAGAQLEKQIGFYAKMVEQIRQTNPGIDLICLSVTPVTKAAQKNRLSQLNIDRFNQALEALCGELGIGYLDVSTALKDKTGCLNRDFSSDRLVHLNEAGYDVIVEALYRYALTRLAE